MVVVTATADKVEEKRIKKKKSLSQGSIKFPSIAIKKLVWEILRFYLILKENLREFIALNVGVLE